LRYEGERARLNRLALTLPSAASGEISPAATILLL
jgi:hypothetical protein